MELASIPQIQGQTYPHYDGRYRIYTAEHLPFDALPEYMEGGPATVTLGSWCVSYRGASGASGYELHIYRSYSHPTEPGAHHEMYGTTYPTMRDATRAAYEAGALGFMVYEKDADRLGLPALTTS